MISEAEALLRLAVALALGLLVGLERGWRQREEPEGARVAGLRTFGIIGLAGGLAGSLLPGDGLFLGLAGVALALLVIYAYWHAGEREDIGATTLIATLVTFVIGITATAGDMTLAASGGIALVLLLAAKKPLHRWVRQIREFELLAALQLLLISVVILPVLPDEGFGPWQALNPRRLWMFVVLISAVSFSGYVAVRLLGERRGHVLIGLFGGLASSTAVAVSLSRQARGQEGPLGSLAAGIIIAASIMFWRIVVLLLAVSPALALELAPPLIAAGTVGVAAAVLIAWRAPATASSGVSTRNPADLRTALRFGVVLAVIAFLAAALRAWAGDAGLYVLALVSGLADVDAITLSLAEMTLSGLDDKVASRAILMAAAVNTLVKIGIVAWNAPRRLAATVGLPLAAALAAGGAMLVS